MDADRLQGSPFEIDLFDQESAMGYDIAAEMDVGLLTGPEELNPSNNSCAMSFKVIRPIENEPFQTF